MFSHTDLLDLCPQFVPVFKAEPQRQVHIEKTWGLNNESADTQPPNRVIKLVLKDSQLLSLWGVCQCLSTPSTQTGETCFQHLYHAQKVGKVCLHKLGYSLIVCLLPHLRLLLTILVQIYCHLPYVRGYQ